MCGIFGLFAEQERQDLAALVQSSLDVIRHRGPDGQGMRCGLDVDCREAGQAVNWALGHMRLAILDLSSAGLQPMSSPDGKCWVTYNGEIYNYVELAEELSQYGYRFRTGTDTEVLVAAYRHWRTRCVEHFRGMFAFALIDLEQRLAMIARDRLGIKPLYQWQQDGLFAVASEIKQFYQLPGFRPRLNEQQATDYLCEGLMGHDADQTFLRDVVPLEPGCLRTWRLGQLPQSDVTRYWEPSRKTVSCDWDVAVERTVERFRDAVRLRLRSDVPVGTCLSGGIDSSSIVGVAARELGAPMKTFSVCHDDDAISEEHYIDEVVQYCNAEPFKLRLTAEQALEDLDRFLYHQDEPVFSLSQYGEYAVMRLAKQNGVTVLLNGQGGDEALCGYRKFAFFYLRQLLAQRSYVGAAKHVTNLMLRGDRQLLQFWQGVRYVPSWLRRRYDPMDEILNPDLLARRRAAWATRMRGVRDLHEHQYADLRYWSLPVLLRYQDRNSMAHGIEARVPMVDHEFLEFALTVPEPFFFRGGMTKRLLVDGLGETLPQSLRQRRTKLGFDTPQARWMHGPLGHELENRVTKCDALGGILDRGAAASAFQRYRAGDKGVPHFVLFRMACLATWLERFRVELA